MVPVVVINYFIYNLHMLSKLNSTRRQLNGKKLTSTPLSCSKEALRPPCNSSIIAAKYQLENSKESFILNWVSPYNSKLRENSRIMY